jgi:hypothetical protein
MLTDFLPNWQDEKWYFIVVLGIIELNTHEVESLLMYLWDHVGVLFCSIFGAFFYWVVFFLMIRKNFSYVLI